MSEAPKQNDRRRATRVSERIREELAVALQETVKDPRTRGVIVSRVEVSDDLRHANIYVRLVSGGEDASERKSALIGLAKASGLLRREVTTRAQLRFAPELSFFYDEGQDAQTRIESLLEEVRKEGGLPPRAEKAVKTAKKSTRADHGGRGGPGSRG